MLGNPPISSLASVAQGCEHLGGAFDRLSWVRVVVGDGATRYEVVGMARHRPRSCYVSAATAASLIGAGLPAVMSRTGDGEP